jgi:hypothetical protein
MGIRGLLAEDGFCQEWCISQKQTITGATNESIVGTCFLNDIYFTRFSSDLKTFLVALEASSVLNLAVMYIYLDPLYISFYSI